MALIQPKRGVIRRPRGPFAFPGTLAGFDPSHFAAGQTSFSGVAVGGSFVNILNGKPGVQAGSPTGSIARFGPVSTYTTTTDQTSFSGQSTANDSGFTFAAILQFSDVTVGTRFIFANSNASNGHAIGASNVAGLNLGIAASGVITVSSGFIPVVNTPYFFAASVYWPGVGQTRIANFALTNLSTGQIQTASATGGTAAPGAPSGTYVIGNRNGQALLGSVAAVMAAPVASSGINFMSVAALQRWAADPWSFWYSR